MRPNCLSLPGFSPRVSVDRMWPLCRTGSWTLATYYADTRSSGISQEDKESKMLLISSQNFVSFPWCCHTGLPWGNKPSSMRFFYTHLGSFPLSLTPRCPQGRSWATSPHLEPPVSPTPTPPGSLVSFPDPIFFTLETSVPYTCSPVPEISAFLNRHTTK